MSLGLHIRLEEVGSKVILRLEGRIDAATAPVLENKIQKLIDEKRFQLLLDFTDVDYLSSAGMRVLLAALKKIKAHHGIFGVFSVTEDVSEIIRLAGFDKILHIFINEQEALQHGI